MVSEPTYCILLCCTIYLALHLQHFILNTGADQGLGGGVRGNRGEEEKDQVLGYPVRVLKTAFTGYIVGEDPDENVEAVTRLVLDETGYMTVDILGV